MTDIHQHYREQRLKDFCRRCEKMQECHGEHCVFWEYKEKEAKDENKTPVNI